MSPGRKRITADHVNGLHLEQDANVLTAMATDGPAGVGGRGVQVFMSDSVLRLLLAHLAADPRWSAAFDAVAADQRRRAQRPARQARTVPNQIRSRLVTAMREAMARSGRPEDPAPRPEILTMPEPPWCELDEDEAYAWHVSLGGAIGRAYQGITTELRSPLDGSTRALITPPDGLS
jgi:hypothetical protein